MSYHHYNEADYKLYEDGALLKDLVAEVNKQTGEPGILSGNFALVTQDDGEYGIQSVNRIIVDAANARIILVI